MPRRLAVVKCKSQKARHCFMARDSTPRIPLIPGHIGEQVETIKEELDHADD